MNNIINQIKKSCIEISNLIRFSDSNLLGDLASEYNISGDNVKKLDLFSNEILKNNLKKIPEIKFIGSEEDESLILVNTDGNYLVCFDPLDGSSNIDVNITTGTIFAIYEYKENQIKNGRNIVAAGYCLYGGSTQLIIAEESNVSMYQLKNDVFEIINSDLRIRNMGSIYSINEANKYIWTDDKYNKLVDDLVYKNYSARWVGSLVADAHRTLLKGGLFAYPGNKKNKEGKIRLLYEAYPFAYIFEKAGGKSSNGDKNILDVSFPKNIHQKTSILLSSPFEFDIFNKL